MKVSRDADFLNRVVNHPSVFPWVSLGQEGPLDLSPVLDLESTVFLADETGGFLFVDCGGGLYEVHTQFLPEGRGHGVLKKAREAARYMFTRTPCLAVKTFVAYGNDAAHKLTLAMGFDEVGEMEILGKPGRLFLLTVKGWVCQQQQYLD